MIVPSYPSALLDELFSLLRAYLALDDVALRRLDLPSPRFLLQAGHGQSPRPRKDP